MTHLNQLLAVAKTTKSRSSKSITEAYHKIQRTEPLSGIARTYRPKSEDGDIYPGETKQVQTRATEVIEGIRSDFTRMLDVQATIDAANQDAQADVMIDGNVVLPDVPVATLLFLEKQLVDLQALFTKMPTLDVADVWVWDSNSNSFRTEPVETHKMKKVPRNHVMAPATDRHPAQVQVYNEDTLEGYWQTVKFSGALPAQEIREIQERISKMLEAVKAAVQEANELEVTDVEVGESFMNYILGDTLRR